MTTDATRTHNEELAAMLAKRGVRLQDLATMIPDRGGRSHVSGILNGSRPARCAADAGRMTRPLTKTWRQLGKVLGADEFACALRFANVRREELGLPLLVAAIPVETSEVHAWSISSAGFIEYVAPDGAPWRVEKGDALAADFDLGNVEADVLAALPLWHAALSATGQAWAVLCRFYAVNPAFGVEDADELEPWSRDKIAGALDLTVADVDLQLSEARVFWRKALESERQRNQRNVTRRELVPVEKTPLTPEEMGAMLRQYGFVALEVEEEQAYAASRIDELAGYLENDQSRSGARSLILQEINLFFGLDAVIAKIRRNIRDAGPNAATSTDDDRLQKILKSRSEAQRSIEDTRDALGLNEAQTGSLRIKAQVQGMVTAIVDGLQRYYAREDTSIIDGMFTLGEVEILTREYSIRPHQYRPDIVASINEALKEANLFDPKWKAPNYGRKAVQRLRAGFNEGLARVRAENGEVIEELDEESSDEILDAREREAGSVGLLAAPASSAPAVQPAVPPPPPRRGGTAGSSAGDGIFVG